MKIYKENELRQMNIKDLGMLLCMKGVTGDYRTQIQEIYIERRNENGKNK